MNYLKKLFLLCCMLFAFTAVAVTAQSDSRTLTATPKTSRTNVPVSAPETVFNTGHSREVSSVAYSPDGKYLASGAEDNTIKIWETTSGKCLKTLEGHKQYVSAVSYSPDGQYLASGSFDRTIKIWDVVSGTCLKTFESGNTSPVNSVSYSPDGKYIVSCDRIQIWEVASGKCLKDLENQQDGNVYFVNYSPDGRYFASCSSSNTIQIWETASGKCLKTLEGHGSWVFSVSYSPDGKYLASGSEDNTIRIWDAASGKCLKTLEGHRDRVSSVSYNSDGKYLVSGGGWDDKTVKIWDAASGKCLKTLEGHGNGVSSVSYSPDGKYLASGSLDKTIKIWELTSGKCLRTFERYASPVVSVDWRGDGRYLASGSEDGIVKISDTANGRCVKTLVGHSGEVSSVAYSPDGKYLASGSEDNTIRIWDAASGKCLKTLEGHGSGVSSVSYSPDGKYLASGSKDNTIKIWETVTGTCMKTMEEDNRVWLTSVSYSPDGKYLASGSMIGSVKIWDVATGTCFKTLEESGVWVTAVRYTSDGKYLVSSTKVWEVTSGKCIQTLEVNQDSVNYSPDSKYFAYGSLDGSVKIWEATSGTLLATVINLKNEEWLCYTPEGFFSGSEWAAKNLVYIVDGMEVIDIDRIYDKLYRPDLVAAKLRGEDVSEYAKNISLANLVRSGEAPLTAFYNLPQTVASRDLTLECTITNTGGGIGLVTLVLNGKNIRLAETVSSSAGETLSFAHTVTLQNGENTLELYAYNAAGIVESRRDIQTVMWKGKTEKPNLYVLAAGINRYRDKSLQLRFAVPDAEALSQAFNNRQNGLYRAVYTMNLFDGDVTKEGLANAFKMLSAQITPDDVFVFYVSGHGTTYEDGDYYYLPVDFRYTGAESIPKNGISKTDLLKNLSLIKADKTLILLDTCNSGAFLSDTNKRGLTEKTAVDRLTRATGHATIAASSDTQSAMEGYNGHGIFTYILVEGLYGKADSNKDGYITLQELSAYLEYEVPERSYQKWGYEQIPQKDLRRQDFPIYTSGNR